MNLLSLVKPKEQSSAPGLGTFAGVYLPSVLTIFGVIMYLRLGLVVGSVGLIPAMTIVLLASSITFVTALSIATSATNMVVKGGGAYYIISRAFGKEIGAAIGLPLYLAQSIGIAFYITGFVESLISVAPGLPAPLVGVGTLLALTILAFISASLAVKAQGFILLAIILSLASFFLGDGPSETVELVAVPKLGFWAAFALFFPAVTGIEAGVSMSGDLKNPSKSLVRGVVAAVITGLVVYMVMVWRLRDVASRDVLTNDPLIVQHIARWGWCILLGIWGATLSSGLGALLGAPRTMQALAQDGILPRFLSKGFGPTSEPRIATVVTFLLSGLCVYLGRIDIIAPILTMFFLMSYGMLNLAAGLEGLVQNPSWRPTFQIPAGFSILGALLCLMAMLMINPGASFVALFLVLIVYLVALRSSLSKGWDDIRQGILLFFSRTAIYRLANTKTSPRSWRPNFLVVTNGYSAPQSLIKFTSCITNQKGFLILAPIFPGGMSAEALQSAKDRIAGMCKLKRIEALIAPASEEQTSEAIEGLITNYGLGPLRPNTVVLGDSSNDGSKEVIAHAVIASHKARRNIAIIVGESEHDFIDEPGDKNETSTIDVWWDDKYKDNSELMLVLAHMHQSSRGYGSMKLNVKCTVPNETARQHRQKFFDEFFSKGRFHINTEVYVNDEEDDRNKLIEHFSRDANLVILGLRPPDSDETVESYREHYRQTVKSHKKLKNLVLVLASEKIDLEAIFQ